MTDSTSKSAPAGAQKLLPGSLRPRPAEDIGGKLSRLRLASVSRYVVFELVALLGGLTLLGLLDRWSPYLELVTVFRLQYAVLLGAAALAAILLRRFPLALAAALLAGVNLLVISQVPTASQAAAGEGRLRVLIVNVQYSNPEYERVARLIRETNPDVVGVSELTPAWASRLEAALERYPDRRLEPHEGAYGIGLYSRVPLADARIERFPSSGGPPSVVATVALGEHPVSLVLTHVHTPFAGGIHDRHLQALAEQRPRLGERLAVCGDFNTVPWSHALRDLADAAGLRSIHGRFGLSGTWPAGVPLLRVPIDNCLVSDGVAVADRRIGPDIGSDHLPVIVELAPARDA